MWCENPRSEHPNEYSAIHKIGFRVREYAGGSENEALLTSLTLSYYGTMMIIVSDSIHKQAFRLH